jgi:hypothetical protein
MEVRMAQNEGRIDEIVLALLYLTTFHQGGEVRAWKTKSVAMSEVGARKAKELFEKYFLSES